MAFIDNKEDKELYYLSKYLLKVSNNEDMRIANAKYLNLKNLLEEKHDSLFNFWMVLRIII